MATASSVLCVGASLLDPERGVLRRPDGAETALRPKTLDLLLLLLRHHGRLVQRAEILDAIWPEVIVTDDSITQCIVEIRRALGPDATLLRTVPRRGYLLELAGIPGEAAPRPDVQPAPATEVPVVAVMPFRLLPPQPDLEIFAQGVLEGIVGALALLREPVVISANSTMRLGPADADPLAIGARLGADYVAAGTVRRSGSHLRLGVELADSRSATVLWHRTYDVTDGDAFETQDRIAAIIAHTLAPRVQEVELARCRRQRPSDMGAYQLLLQARHLIFRMDRDAFERAGGLLRRAVALDPDFANLHAEIAAWHGLRVGQGWSEDRGAEISALDRALEAALARDSSHSRALAMLGHNHAIMRRHFEDAVAASDRALTAAPNDAEAWLWSVPTFAWMGEGQEAVRRAERAMALSPEDPLMFRFEHFRSIAHYCAGEPEAAAEWGLRSMRSNPHYTSNLRMTAASLVASGRRAQATLVARRVLELEPGFRVGPMIAGQAMRDDAARQRYGEHLLAAGLPA